MQEPLEITLLAMLAYISFPEAGFNEVGLHYQDVRELESTTFAADAEVFAVKQAGAIAAKRLS